MLGRIEDDETARAAAKTVSDVAVRSSDEETEELKRKTAWQGKLTVLPEERPVLAKGNNVLRSVFFPSRYSIWLSHGRKGPTRENGCTGIHLGH